MRKENCNSSNKEIIQKSLSFWREALLFGVLLAMIFFSISAVIPPSYKAYSSIAVNQSRVAGLDAYREAKSAEFIAQTIKEMILANSFMWGVLRDDEINWLEMDNIKAQDEKIKFWKKKIKVSVIPNTGVLSILVYTRDRELSKQVLTKIIAHLQGEGGVLLVDKGVRIEIINEPYYFHKPASPVLLLNTALGFVVGVTSAMILVFIGKAEQFRFFNTNRKMYHGGQISFVKFSEEDVKNINKGKCL